MELCLGITSWKGAISITATKPLMPATQPMCGCHQATDASHTDTDVCHQATDANDACHVKTSSEMLVRITSSNLLDADHKLPVRDVSVHSLKLEKKLINYNLASTW